MVDAMAYDESYHWCPNCLEPYQVCTCEVRDCSEPDDDPEHELGCDFPGECCMPGEHMRSECHTAEMIEQWNEDGAKAEAELFKSVPRGDGERNG